MRDLLLIFGIVLTVIVGSLEARAQNDVTFPAYGTSIHGIKAKHVTEAIRYEITEELTEQDLARFNEIATSDGYLGGVLVRTETFSCDSDWARCDEGQETFDKEVSEYQVVRNPWNKIGRNMDAIDENRGGIENNERWNENQDRTLIYHGETLNEHGDQIEENTYGIHRNVLTNIAQKARLNEHEYRLDHNEAKIYQNMEQIGWNSDRIHDTRQDVKDLERQARDWASIAAAMDPASIPPGKKYGLTAGYANVGFGSGAFGGSVAANTRENLDVFVGGAVGLEEGEGGVQLGFRLGW